AWQDVWISPDPRGHLQVTGRDARGRKQYRYHPQWIEMRSRTNFDRLPEFAAALPRLRRAVSRGLRGRAPATHDQVVALAVRLLGRSLLRLGNESYRQENQSYGLTTLRTRHVRVRRESVKLAFYGKSRVRQQILLRDHQIARHLRRLQELPGQELLQYLGA